MKRQIAVLIAAVILSGCLCGCGAHIDAGSSDMYRLGEVKSVPVENKTTANVAYDTHTIEYNGGK